MRVGIKIFPDRLRVVNQLSKLFDFIELMATPSLSNVRKTKVPFIIHAPHFRYKFNPADKRLEKYNLKLMNHTIKIADKLKSKKIIVHAGHLRNKNCSKKNSLKFLKKINDNRIIIENLCAKDALNKTPQELKAFTKELKCGICFDFSHAITTSYNLGYKSYKSFVRRFLKLKPEYFHICDGFYDGKDRHLDIGKGNYDLDFIKQCIGKKPVTLEITSRTLPSLKKQVELIV